MVTSSQRDSTAKGSTPATRLRVYSTLSKSKEPFEPVTPGKVGIYLCGPTVYKPSHIGHMVGPVIFDTIKRYLTYCGYQVTLVINITDVDDKLIHESTQRGIPMSQLAAEMTADYMSNLEALGVDGVDHFPRATENIDEIIGFVQTLIDQGYAYASDGDVFFDVNKDAEYGKLSGRSPEEMQGEGGEAAARKRSLADFALWKGAKPGEPAWDSPWGKGRPGWHIECSAMSRRLLGESFDIHGGGLDLVFPHHENEIAQSECCHHKPMARYWLHNGLMQAADQVGKVGGRQTRELAAGDVEAQSAAKISKSRGSAPFRELLRDHPAEAIRFFLVSTHYRSPILYSEDLLRDAQQRLERFYQLFRRWQRISGQTLDAVPYATRREAGEFDPGDDETLRQIAEHRRGFLEAMDDDFNTAGALGHLFPLVSLLNSFIDRAGIESGRADERSLGVLRRGIATLRELGAILGLFRRPLEPQAAGADDLTPRLMELLIEIRAELRKAKNFQLADTIRGRLAELGIVLEDRANQTEWRLQR